MKLSGIIKNNKMYVILFVFILLVNLAAFVLSLSEKEGTSDPGTVRDGTVQADGKTSRIKTVLTREETQAQREKINSLMKKDPVLYLFISFFELLILFAVFIGFLLDGYFIAGWIKKKPPDICLFERPEAAWTIGDVLRVVLIFLSCGYAFAILQGPFMKYAPILKNENFSMIINTGVINIGAIAVIVYFVVKKYGQDISALGLSFKKTIPAILIGITGYAAVTPVILAIMFLTFFVVRFLGYEPPVQPIVEVFMKEKEIRVLGFSIFFAAVCGPIAEEIFFRGFMYSTMKKKMGALWAIFITSVLFSLLHTHPVGFLPIMVLGVVLAYLYERTGSIIPSITVHVIHNVSTVFMVFIAKYLNT